MKLVWCRGCRHWFDRKQHGCPECGTPRHAPNEGLRAARINSNLLEQKRRATAEA